MNEGIAVPLLQVLHYQPPTVQNTSLQVSPTSLMNSELKEMSRTPNLETTNHFVKEHLVGIETHLQKFLKSN